PAPPAMPVSPLDAFTAVVQTEDALVVRRGPGSAESAPARGSLTFLSPSPDGSSVAAAVGGTLFLVSRADGSILKLDEGPADRIYTGSWSADEAFFHFGYYVPAANGAMGAGDIRTFDRVNQVVTRVGCSASKAVLAALPDGSLLVRNTDNIYQVEADGCGTLRTVDARKLHHVLPSPDGGYLAYILRDLVFNRDRRAYEPDSTLHIESTAGSEPVKVIGDKYSPRNLSWSLDGSELLYDVAPPADEAMRAVSIYTVSDGRSSYLIPPSSSQAMTHAHSSPSGRHVLVRVTGQDGSADWQVKLSGAPFVQALPLPDAGTASIRWVGDDHLLVQAEDGSSHVLSLASGTPERTALDRVVLWLWPSE
ncbi:MAG: hypothetical protein O2899_07205, partial [Bacteroidetes bacterium]|nr:hypothetical protein [Bacteroidota bacterium]